MTPTMTPVPEDHPLMVAWTGHKQTEEYANSLKWAADEKQVEGSLWALFMAGWEASAALAQKGGAA